MTLAGLGSAPSPRSDADTIYPLLCGQRWLAYVHRHEPGFARPVQRLYRLRRPLDTAALLAALRHVVSAHPSLRLRLVETRDGWEQCFPPLEAEIAGVAVTGRTADVRAAYARSVLAADAERPIDLTHEPPFRARIVEVDGEHYLGLSLDHLAADELGGDLLELELNAAYERELRGEPQPPGTADAFLDYLTLEPARRRKEAANLAYWAGELAGAPLAAEGDEPAWVPGESCAWELPAGALRELEAACRARRCSVFAAVLAAQAESLRRGAQTDDLVVNVPVSNRVRPAEHTWIANLSMLLHLRLRLPAEGTVTYVRDRLLDAMAHRQVDYSELAAAVAAETASRGGRVHWTAGSSFVDERGTPPRDDAVLAERLDEEATGLVSLPSGSCAFTARRHAGGLRVSVVWDPARLALAEALAEADLLETLHRLTGTR